MQVSVGCEQLSGGIGWASELLQGGLSGFEESGWPSDCKMWGKKFFRQSTLNVPMRWHTGENRYKCGDTEERLLGYTAL